MNHELVKANMDKLVEPIGEVKRLLETLREAWEEVQDSVQPGANGPLSEGTGLNLKG